MTQSKVATVRHGALSLRQSEYMRKTLESFSIGQQLEEVLTKSIVGGIVAAGSDSLESYGTYDNGCSDHYTRFTTDTEDGGVCSGESCATNCQ